MRGVPGCRKPPVGKTAFSKSLFGAKGKTNKRTFPLKKNVITILNLNMLYLKYFDKIDRELHIPLGPLYLARALEDAGFPVDFRDYQLNEYDDAFSIDNCIDFLHGSADIIGISVMANLLPFAILLSQEFKRRFPDKTIVLGGVGASSVESEILERFPEIDIVAYGEFEKAGPILLDHLINSKELSYFPQVEITLLPYLFSAVGVSFS